MRGKPSLTLKYGCVQRNIPAYAGKTASGAVGGGGDEEHPRVCGENRNDVKNFTLFSGTSPRMRGKPARCLSPHAVGRNIPAYAGKTWLWRF